MIFYLVRSSVIFIPSLLLAIPAILFCIFIRILPNRNRNRQILVAGVEISSNISQISTALKQSGQHEVSLIHFLERDYCVKNDLLLTTFRIGESFVVRSIRLSLRPFYLFPVAAKFGTVVFNWYDSFLFGNLDYPLLRLAGTRLVVRHCGDDVRYRPLQHGIHSHFGVQQWRDSPRNIVQMFAKIWRQRISERFATVLSTRDHATFQGRPLTIRPYTQSPLPRTSGFERDVPLILHAPTDPKIKGTAIVEEALSNLKELGYCFDHKILTGVRHDEVLNTLSSATIVIDQPGAFPVRLATEAMASGCAVLGGNVPELNDMPSCPVVLFKPNVEELQNAIENLLKYPDECKRIGEACFRFWEDNFTPCVFVRYFERVLDGSAPTFERIDRHAQYLLNAASKWYEKIAVRLLYDT